MSLSAIERRIAALAEQMRQAAAVEDFETAARLRNEIAALKGQAPAQMGLGTHLPVVAPPAGWTRPRKPDPMTRSTGRSRPPAKR